MSLTDQERAEARALYKQWARARHREGSRRGGLASSPRGSANRQWKGDDLGSYTAAHTRAKALRNEPCAHCGVTDRPRDCALSHDAPAEHLRVDQSNSHDRGKAYSVEPADYLPLCRPCHRKYDGKRQSAGSTLPGAT